VWKASYDQETDSLVQAAVRSTVEVLEKIHSLGLQEVGMRWVCYTQLPFLEASLTNMAGMD